MLVVEYATEVKVLGAVRPRKVSQVGILGAFVSTET